MCACNGTGVIQNDMGSGMYQFVGCICKAGQRSHEEIDQRRQEVMDRLKLAHQMQMEGTWDDEAYRRFKEGKQSDNSTGAVIHERTAS